MSKKEGILRYQPYLNKIIEFYDQIKDILILSN